MAVINDTGDKMRDIIAQAAEGLENGADDGAEELADGGDAAAAESADGVSDGAEGDNTDDGAAGGGDGAAGADGARAAGDVAEAAAGKVADTKDAAAIAAEAAKVAGATADAAKGAKGKKDDEHPFAKEHGIKSKDAHGRENRIPFSRMLKINENTVKKEKVKWEAEVLKPSADKNVIYEKRLADIGETEKIMFEQPRRYVAMLAAIPGYKALFDEISGGKFTVDGKTASDGADGTNIATDANDPMPVADAKDDKGNIVGWTQAGLDKRFAWERRQAARDGAKAAKAEFEKEFKPVKDRFASVEATEKAGQDIDSIIGVAATWPGFKENHAAILDVVAKDTAPLDTPQKMYQAVQAAYNTVMFGTLSKAKETEEQTRQRYFDEFQASLKKAPRSTAAVSTVSRKEPVVEEDNVSPDDRMRNIIMESTRKAGLIK